jgi:hypothetical protein
VPYADSYSVAYANSDSHSHSHCNSYRHGHSNCHGYAYGYGDSYSYCDVYRVTPRPRHAAAHKSIEIAAMAAK